MKKMTIRLAAVVLCIWMGSVAAWGTERLVPVGQVIGMSLSDDSVTVASFDQTLGETARAAGLREGDRILSIDGKAVTCAEDVRRALAASKGFVSMTVARGGKEERLRLRPQITAEGPKLGVYLKQGVTGIGTVTYFDPETGYFGALGHGVNGCDGKLLDMVAGQVYPAAVVSVKMGKTGEPGQLRGAVTEPVELGALFRNTARGVFGKTEAGWEGEAIPVASAQEVCEGAATILATVSEDGVREYSVEILKIYPKSKKEGRNLMLKITDPALLAATGGIVQGMSGSPIIQDGKLVGAVTHVLVNDPTRGYGIFIENMLDAAK